MSLNRDETTLLAPRGRFERCFPKGILTYCFNNVGVLFLKGPVSSSFQSATLYLAQRTARLHSTTQHGQHGLQKISQVLMNMDEQLQLIIGRYVTDFAWSFVFTLSQLIKNQAKWKALWVRTEFACYKRKNSLQLSGDQEITLTLEKDWITKNCKRPKHWALLK